MTIALSIEAQFRLELERPSGDRVYYSDEEFPNDHNFNRVWPEERDEISRLTLGATRRDFDLVNSSALALATQYRNQNDSVQFRLADLIVNAIASDNSQVVASLVLELGLIDAVERTFKAQAIALIATAVAEALRYRPRTLTEGELQRLRIWMESWMLRSSGSGEVDNSLSNAVLFSDLSSAVEIIKDVQRFRMRKTVLAGDNPSIERDRRELAEYLARLGVSDDIQRLLHSADNDAGSGDYKGGLEKLRTFLERTYEECCRKRAEAQGTASTLPLKTGGNIKPWLDWARDNSLLSKHEYAVVQAISSFQAMEGSHAVKSQPRQYTVAKACVIEWCLLLAERTQNQ